MLTMLKKDFWYDLPKELIAQEPASPRDAARLMVLSQKDDSIQHRIFHDLPEYLEPGDLLVVNNSKVLPARIVGIKQPTGAVCELLLLRQGKYWRYLKITEVHDWAQVYADGKLLARLDRRKGEFTTTLPVLKKGTQLDILIEAMGRVNFDKSIHDRKGITEKVELISGNQTTELKNWTVYNFPVDYSFIKDKKYNETKQLPTMPAYYKGTFKLASTRHKIFS